MTSWGLPTTAEIYGAEYLINTDFRDILEIIEVLQDRDKHEQVRVLVALNLFYEEFEKMPQDQYTEAFKEMLKFIALGEPDDNTNHPKLIDWEQDRSMIASEINKVAGVEVRGLDYLHWWTFIGYFNSIGEGQLSYIVSIRSKLKKGKKLEKHEQEFYRNNRSRVELKQKLTKEEEALLKAWLV